MTSSHEAPLLTSPHLSSSCLPALRPNISVLSLCYFSRRVNWSELQPDDGRCIFNVFQPPRRGCRVCSDRRCGGGDINNLIAAVYVNAAEWWIFLMIWRAKPRKINASTHTGSVSVDPAGRGWLCSHTNIVLVRKPSGLIRVEGLRPKWLSPLLVLSDLTVLMFISFCVWAVSFPYPPMSLTLRARTLQWGA